MRGFKFSVEGVARCTLSPNIHVEMVRCFLRKPLSGAGLKRYVLLSYKRESPARRRSRIELRSRSLRTKELGRDHLKLLHSALFQDNLGFEFRSTGKRRSQGRNCETRVETQLRWDNFGGDLDFVGDTAGDVAARHRKSPPSARGLREALRRAQNFFSNQYQTVYKNRPPGRQGVGMTVLQ